jgi:hypothetical protein
MNLAGLMLIMAGFLWGAYQASLDPELMNWPVFIPSLVAGFLGVYLRKRVAAKHAMSEHVLASNRSNIEESLARIVAGLEDMDARKESLPTYEARFEIDRRFRSDLDMFAEARHSLSHMYGLQSYAEIMSAFAAGERYLNRVWSASADGYVNEVNEYLGRALSMFKEARSALDTAHSGSGGAV